MFQYHVSLTSTTPGMCLGGVWTLMAWLVISSDHTSIVPNTTCIQKKSYVI